MLGPALAITISGILFAFIGESAAKSLDPKRWTANSATDESERSSVGSTDGASIDDVPSGQQGLVAEETHEGVVRDNRDGLLVVRDLAVRFPGEGGAVAAVRGVDLYIQEGEALGIVGESGSGKTMTALAIAGLVPHPGEVTAAELSIGGVNLLNGAKSDVARALATNVAMIFQDPMSSLTPTVRIGTQLTEGIQYTRDSDERKRGSRP